MMRQNCARSEKPASVILDSAKCRLRCYPRTDGGELKGLLGTTSAEHRQEDKCRQRQEKDGGCPCAYVSSTRLPPPTPAAADKHMWADNMTLSVETGRDRRREREGDRGMTRSPGTLTSPTLTADGGRLGLCTHTTVIHLPPPTAHISTIPPPPIQKANPRPLLHPSTALPFSRPADQGAAPTHILSSLLLVHTYKTSQRNWASCSPLWRHDVVLVRLHHRSVVNLQRLCICCASYDPAVLVATVQK